MSDEQPCCYQVERGVYSLVNGLVSDTGATAENSYTAATLTPDGNVRNLMFPPSFVRENILNV